MHRVSVVALFLYLSMVAGNAIAHNIRLPEKIEQIELTRIAENTYAIHGLLALPDRDNLGFISNTGVVITKHGVVVIDTGGSAQVGELIVHQIQAITSKPIIAVFNTHVHGDHWLGNAAIRKSYPDVKIYAHSRAIERLQNGEASQWLDTVTGMTDNAIAGTELVLPNEGLSGGEQLQIDGLAFKTHHTGHAHTDSDIMVELPQQRVLFAGDIIEHRRAVSVDVPEDFSATGQIEAIRYALELPIDIYLPGHGETGGREIPEASLRFLETLYSSVQGYYEEGMADFEMRERVAADLAEFEDWSGFDELGKLISHVYLQVEAAEFE